MAEQLGMTVGELQHRMTNAEFVSWTRYYARKAQREELAAREAGR